MEVLSSRVLLQPVDFERCPKTIRSGAAEPCVGDTFCQNLLFRPGRSSSRSLLWHHH